MKRTILFTILTFAMLCLFAEVNVLVFYNNGNELLRLQSAQVDSLVLAEVDPPQEAASARSDSAVDMGLSVKWATFNIGATRPSENGDLLCWGDTKIIEDRARNCATYGQTMRRDISGNLTYDAARALWGGSWRMPTKVEFEELFDEDNCSWTWTSQDGITGYLVTSKITGNSIFFPVNEVRPNYISRTAIGYWTATPRDVEEYSFFARLNEGSKAIGYTPRYVDYLVRPVTNIINDQPLPDEPVTPPDDPVIPPDEPVTPPDDPITPPDEPEKDGYEYVDLGLSVKWATHNIGAKTPGEYGDYLAWGESQPKDYYDTSNYSFSSETDITGTEHDAAVVRWGGHWRMPDRKEIEEMIDKCTFTWVQCNDTTGNYGIEVKGPNGNTIFLPAGGYPNWSGWNRVGEYGTYWTGSRASYDTSCYFNFDEYNLLGLTDYDGATYVGQLVRPVYDETLNNPDVPVTPPDDPVTPPDDPGEDTHEYVDLGLSVKWAVNNIGAKTPDEYGDYLAWGESQPKDYYDTWNYTFSSESDITGTEYDAAVVRWGGHWRMPDRKDVEEMISKCTFTWKQYNDTGNYGIEVKGPNGNTIFLPAGGYPNWSGWNRVGEYGTYWTGSRASYDTSCYFNFDAYSSLGLTDYDGATYVGQLIRPVYDENINNPIK